MVFLWESPFGWNYVYSGFTASDPRYGFRRTGRDVFAGRVNRELGIGGTLRESQRFGLPRDAAGDQRRAKISTELVLLEWNEQ